MCIFLRRVTLPFFSLSIVVWVFHMNIFTATCSTNSCTVFVVQLLPVPQIFDRQDVNSNELKYYIVHLCWVQMRPLNFLKSPERVNCSFIIFQRLIISKWGKILTNCLSKVTLLVSKGLKRLRPRTITIPGIWRRYQFFEKYSRIHICKTISIIENL